MLHLATTEAIATALIYDSLLFAHLEELARSRDELNPRIPDFAAEFASLLSKEQPRLKLQAASQTAMVAPPPKAPLKDKAPKVEKFPKKGCLPKKEYLGKLAGDRSATARDTAKRSPSPKRSKNAAAPRSAIRRRKEQIARQLRTGAQEDIRNIPPSTFRGIGTVATSYSLFRLRKQFAIVAF